MNSGIYKLNWSSGHFYIGSSNNLKIRKANHLNLLKRKVHGSAIVQKTYNSYGEPAFLILEYCSENVLREKEMEYIGLYTGNKFLLNKSKTYTKKNDATIYIRPSDPGVTKQLIAFAEKKQWSLNKYVLHILQLHIKQKSK